MADIKKTCGFLLYISLIVGILLFVIATKTIDREKIPEEYQELKNNPLVILAILFLAGEIGSELSLRLLRLPRVVGYLSLGIIIGPSVLHLITITATTEAFFEFFMELAVFLLLFRIGLHMDVNIIKKNKTASIYTAISEITLAFITGVITGRFLLNLDIFPSFLFAAAFSATSATVSAVTLTEFKQNKSQVANIIIGAAIIDDIFGLICLVIISALISGNTGSSAILSLSGAIIFGIFYTLIALLVIPVIINYAKERDFEDSGGKLILGFGFLWSIIGSIFFSFSSAIVAFLTGLVVSVSGSGDMIYTRLEHVFNLFGPIFFVIVGISADISQVANGLSIFAFLWIAANLSKLIGGAIGAYLSGINSNNALKIGFGLMPRGEVTAIIANLALSHNLISNTLYGVIIAMIVATTVITPIFLKKAYRHTLTIEEIAAEEL